MQWILQKDYSETIKLGAALEQLGIQHSFERMRPFVGDFDPKPVIRDPKDVIIFGLYSTRNYAKKHGLSPGVFELNSFVHEECWSEFCLNSAADSIFTTVADISAVLESDGRDFFFVRPVEDDKAVAGKVLSKVQIAETFGPVMNLKPADIFPGFLGPTTELMVAEPVNLLAEWRLWVVDNQVVAYSLYKRGPVVMWRPEVDEDVRRFADMLIEANPRYAPAYCVDICRTDDGLRLLETNNINSAGFYEANLVDLARALESRFSK
jgi:hypothetical protein